jgi:hypothetical protein
MGDQDGSEQAITMARNHHQGEEEPELIAEDRSP